MCPLSTCQHVVIIPLGDCAFPVGWAVMTLVLTVGFAYRLQGTKTIVLPACP